MRLTLFTSIALFASLSLTAQALPDFTPPSPLFAAASRNNTAEVKRLLDAGAKPDEVRFIGFTPIFFSVLFENADMFRIMMDRGADIRAVDGSGSSLLMWAAANESGSPQLVEMLLKLGLNPNQANKFGDTALTWAQRRGYTPTVASLMKVTAVKGDPHKQAVERAIAVMQKSGPQFVRVSGCVSCHHQSLPQMANSLARARGYAVNESIAKQEVGAVVTLLKAVKPAMDNKTDMIPDTPISFLTC